MDMKNVLLITCAAALLAGCPTEMTVPPDAPTICAQCGSDGLPILTVGSTADPMPANMDCPTRAEPPAGTASTRTFRLISRGTSTADIPNGDFEIWPSNAVGGDCAAAGAECIALTSGADALVTASLEGDFYAYRVPQNSAAMTYTAIGYNFSPDGDGENEITTIPVAIFSAAITLIRSGMMADPADGILTGDVTDCDGEGMRGVTVRLFDSAGAEIVDGTGPLDPGHAYRANGSLPSRMLPTTDYSGGYASGNLPIIAADPRIAVVAYGTAAPGGEREIIGCEEVTIGTNAITILSFGPYRSDYAAGNLCLAHAPPS
jgi:hypothetical protein